MLLHVGEKILNKQVKKRRVLLNMGKSLTKTSRVMSQIYTLWTDELGEMSVVVERLRCFKCNANMTQPKTYCVSIGFYLCTYGTFHGLSPFVPVDLEFLASHWLMAGVCQLTYTSYEVYIYLIQGVQQLTDTSNKVDYL